MKILLRITMLGGFIGAGIMLAVWLASQQRDESERPDQVPAAAAAAELAAPTDPSPAPARAIDQAQTATARPIVPAASLAPAPLPPPQLDQKLAQLEMKLEMIQQREQDGRIARLEDKLNEIAAATHQSQQRLEQATSQQQQQLAEAARQQQLLLMSLAQAVSTSGPPAVAQAAPPTAPAKPAPAPTVGQDEAAAGEGATPPEADQQEAESGGTGHPGIHKGEGDDTLTLNLRGDDLREVLEFLSAEGDLNILATSSVQGQVTATLSNVDIRTALEAILKSTGYVARYDGNFVYVGKPEDFKQMDQMQDRVAVRIYRTNYVTAAELQKLITPILTEGIGTVTVSTAAEMGIPSDQNQTGGDSFAGNEVIMVRDYEQVLKQIDEVVAQVDTQPRQIAIEATILSVNLNDEYKLGVDFELLRKRAHVRVIGNSPLVDLAAIDTTQGGLHFGFLDSDLATFIEALETFGDTDVIASPHLVCLNKQRAEILIGDQKGYVSTTQTETATTQTVEFLDLGTQLRIRPFIATDGMIRLEVHPELSTGDVKLLGGFALPEKSTTQVTTNIMCRDGTTVVIGGLIRQDTSKTIRQIPLLGNIPVLGALVRNRNETVDRNEIIVLITPRIIHDPAEWSVPKPTAEELAARHGPVPGQKTDSITRRFYGRRYFRLANSAWRSGDLPSALDYLNLSLHFYPENKEAQQLEAAILSSGMIPSAETDLLQEGEEVLPVPVPVEQPDEPPPPETQQPLPSGPRLFQLPPVDAQPASAEFALPDDPPLPPALDYLGAG